MLSSPEAVNQRLVLDELVLDEVCDRRRREQIDFARAKRRTSVRTEGLRPCRASSPQLAQLEASHARQQVSNAWQTRPAQAQSVRSRCAVRALPGLTTRGQAQAGMAQHHQQLL